ncbi:copper chaperone PCu(A)C [Vibrio sp. MEBiC08052]|uniref:copper chaperone PCu(A)C n=1 Tax=Vibrio sp. MEBiC08052 TaxID=1761910 RepID=UPI0007413C94|nr:copper chaperone PCu(A)C [Vibrio sp. MEBiC08052]
MTNFSWRRAAGIFIFMVVTSVTFAATSAENIEVGKAQIFMPQRHASSTGSKMTIYNRSEQPLMIREVTSQRFQHIMLHTTTYQSGKREMHPVDQITVAAHQKLALTPNTSHIMLMGFTQPLQMGELVSLILHTNQGPVTVIARVVPMSIR